jgi:hypothetical protein
VAIDHDGQLAVVRYPAARWQRKNFVLNALHFKRFSTIDVHFALRTLIATCTRAAESLSNRPAKRSIVIRSHHEPSFLLHFVNFRCKGKRIARIAHPFEHPTGSFGIVEHMLPDGPNVDLALEHMPLRIEDQRLLLPRRKAILNVMEIAPADVGLIVNLQVCQFHDEPP